MSHFGLDSINLKPAFAIFFFAITSVFIFIIDDINANLEFELIDFWRFSYSVNGKNFIGVTAMI